MALVKCPVCGVKVFDSSNVCTHCGYEFFKCRGCGNLIERGTLKCPDCGCKFEEAEANFELPSPVLPTEESLDGISSDEVEDDDLEQKSASQKPRYVPKHGPENDKSRPFRITFEYWHKQSLFARLSGIMPQKRFACRVINVIRVIAIAAILILAVALSPEVAAVVYFAAAPLFLGWVWVTSYFDSMFVVLMSLVLKRRIKKTGGDLPYLTESAFNTDIDDLEGFPKKLHILRLRALVGAGIYTENPHLPIMEFVGNTAMAASWFIFRTFIYFALLMFFLSSGNLGLIIAGIACVVSGVVTLAVGMLVSFIFARIIKDRKYDWLEENLPRHYSMFLNLPFSFAL